MKNIGPKDIPAVPGVYFFKDRNGEILYIGKAANLRNRIKSYFAGQPANARLAKLLETAGKVTWQETNSEIEALILESQLIKKHRPPFNIMLRDDKQYFYVGFMKEEFPRIFLTHQPFGHSDVKKFKTQISNFNSNPNVLKFKTENLNFRADNSDFTGPFTDGQAIKTTLKLLRKIFPYCTCKQKHNNYCLNYHIGKCAGLCCLKNHETCNMKHETKRYNQNIRAIKKILTGKRTALIKTLKKEMEKFAEKENFEEAASLRDKIEKLEKVFQNASIVRNANLQTRANATNQNQKAIEELKRVLKLPNLSGRIEGYDVANIQGRFATGAMVVFIDGQPDKNQYRLFKIRNSNIEIRKKSKIQNSKLKNASDFGFRASDFQGSGGDTAMLCEVLTRRFNHPEWPRPDLIIVDGGKAQLNVMKHVTYNMKHKKKILVIAITKNEKHRGVKIFTENKKEPLPLSKLPPTVCNLILQVDSEAHRFAIGYYRKLHRIYNM